MANELVFVINTQQEFWAREFGAKVIEKDENFINLVKDLVSQKIRPVVQLDKDFTELAALKTLPKNSIIGWFPSDEKFDLAYNAVIAQMESLHIVLRPYHLREFTLKNTVKSLAYSFSNVKMAKGFIDILRTVAWQFRGFGVQIRQHKILQIHKKTKTISINIPIGYTNVFALSLLRLVPNAHEEQQSILSIEPSFFYQRQTEVCFVGQSGQIVREFAIRSLEKSELGSVLRRPGYGASNVIDHSVAALGKEYVEMLLGSQFVLCPPGNISGQSFRYFEAIILGRIPLVMNHVTSDPNFRSGYLYEEILPSTGSWGKLLKASQKIDCTDISELIQKNDANLKNEILRLKELILTAVNQFQQEHN